MKLQVNILNKLFVDYYFYLFNLVALISAVVLKMRSGAICAIIILISFYLFSRSKKIKDIDFLFVLYIFFNAVSIFWYPFNGENISLYFSGVSYNLIPSLLFFIGFWMNKNSLDNILDTIFYSNFVIALIGLLLFMYDKTLYFSYMDTEFAHSYTYAHKFGSYLTCLVFGSMCVSQVGLIIYRFFANKKGLMTIVAIPVLLYTLLLNMERGAWFASLILISIVLFFLLIDANNYRRAIKAMAIVFVLAVGFYSFLFNYVNDDTFAYFNNRVNASSDFFSSRSDQMDKAMEVFSSYPLGYGLGAAGNKAAFEGSRIVPDGNYFRILVETGVLGFSVFMLIVIRGTWRGFHGDLSKKILTSIVVAYLAHATGSNVFDFFYSSYIFWLLLGAISRPVVSCNNFFVLEKK